MSAVLNSDRELYGRRRCSYAERHWMQELSYGIGITFIPILEVTIVWLFDTSVKLCKIHCAPEQDVSPLAAFRDTLPFCIRVRALDYS